MNRPRPKGLVSALMLLLLSWGCSDHLLPDGERCGADGDCRSGFCYAAYCLSPDEDADRDGLSNRDERRLGTHPFDADSDGDGKDDGAEAGDPLSPSDRDGDGSVDALENAVTDGDGDCLPDEIDPNEETRAEDTAEAKRYFCRSRGVCEGAWQTVLFTCVGGQPVCDYGAVKEFEADERSCDYVDNDCDGQTDESSLFEGALPGGICVARGICTAGVVECDPVNATPRCSTRARGSSSLAVEEICNGIDDDCDGQTDEELTGPLGSRIGSPCNGRGACGAGVLECNPDSGGVVCSAEPGGSASEAREEACDSVDNDCDGDTDEDLIREGDESCPRGGVCSDGFVWKTCVTGEWLCTYSGSSYEEGVERSCDGRDNDCDGETDEDFFFQDADALPKVVGAQCGFGVCSGGTVVCSSETESGTACSTADLARDETCSGLDDDCDGSTDEDMLYAGHAVDQPCDGLGLCGSGFVVCTAAGAATCSTNPGGSASEAEPERCDGQDNDCDGNTDEDVPPPIHRCQGEGVCAGAPEAPDCLGGEWVCDYTGLADYEPDYERTCDGLDNNCDGRIDELFVHRFSDTWSNLSSGCPAVRRSAAMTLSPSGPTLLLFGGLAGGPEQAVNPLLDDLWTTSLQDTDWEPWVSESGSVSPPPTSGARFVSEELGERVLLVGGYEKLVGGELLPHTEVWELAVPDQAGETPPSWRKLATEDAPAGWVGHDAALDQGRGVLWVFGLSANEDDAPLQALRLSNGRWTAAPTGPAGRSGASLSHDEGGDALVLYGGLDTSGLPSTLNAHRYHFGSPTPWEELETESNPPPRSLHAACIDSERRRLIVHGGLSPDGGMLADTWVLDLDHLVWQPLEAAVGPGARADARLLPVSGTNTALLVGGFDQEGSNPRDIWALDLASLTWQRTALSSNAAPPPLRAVATALDDEEGHWYVMAGRTQTLFGEDHSDETWIRRLDDDVWQPVSSGGTPPPPLAEAAATFDSQRRRVLLFGGRTENELGQEALDGRLWALEADTQQWSELTFSGAHPAPRAGHSVVFSPHDACLRVFGGRTDEGVSNDLWVYDTNADEWHLEIPTSTPPPAFENHVAIWSARQHVMYVAGDSGNAAHVLKYDADTREWLSIATWSDYSVAAGALWKDPMSDKLLLGIREPGSDGATFLVVEEGEEPEARTFSLPAPQSLSGASFVYDTRTRTAHLFGGSGEHGLATNELWMLPTQCP